MINLETIINRSEEECNISEKNTKIDSCVEPVSSNEVRKIIQNLKHKLQVMME